MVPPYLMHRSVALVIRRNWLEFRRQASDELCLCDDVVMIQCSIYR